MTLLPRLLFVLCVSVLSTVCQNSPYRNKATSVETPLKTSLGEHFLIGAALSDQQISGKEQGTLAFVSQHFNSVTVENAMKWATIHPQPHQYDFTKGSRKASPNRVVIQAISPKG